MTISGTDRDFLSEDWGRGVKLLRNSLACRPTFPSMQQGVEPRNIELV